MKIVLFGVKGSGKDTVGDLLKQNHGFTKMSFAAPIKEMAKLMFGFSDYELYGPSSAREVQHPEYPFSGPCLNCNNHVLFDDAFATHGMCVSCGMEYPRYLNARIVCVTLGTELGRRLFCDVWIDSTFRLIDKLATTYQIPVDSMVHSAVLDTVVTDGRFHNELKRSRELGALCVRLTRGMYDSTSTHASETELISMHNSDFDYVLDNANISLDALPAAVVDMLTTLRALPC